MSDDRDTRGIPLPTAWHWLLVVTLALACWLIWPKDRNSQSNSRNGPQGEPVSAALENLRQLEAIARSGPEGVPELVAALKSLDHRFRRNALLGLRSMGTDAAAATDAVRERLADPDPQVRLCAVDAFWSIHRDPDGVCAIVAPLLGDGEASVRDTTARVLQSFGPKAIHPIAELLQTGALAAKVPALTVLRRIRWGETQPQIEQVVRDQSQDANLRIEALRTLATWGNPTAAELRELLQQPDREIGSAEWPTEPGPREVALRAMVRHVPTDTENLEDILNLLTQPRTQAQPWIQWNLALSVLQNMGSTAQPAEPRLLQLANETNDSSRIDIGWTLLRIGGDSQQIVRILQPLLTHKDTDLSFHAGRLYVCASPEQARRQVSQLIPWLTDEKLAKGLSPLNAVWGLAPEAQESLPALVRLLESRQPHVAAIAARTLRDMGPQAAAAVPVLLAQLARVDTQDYMRRTFVQTIGKIGDREAIPFLLAELNAAPLTTKDLNQVGQSPIYEILSALVRLGASDEAVLAAIRRRLASDDPIAPVSAIRALEQLSSDHAEIIARYLECLCNQRGLQARVEIILTIGRLAGDRKDAIPLLIALLTDRSPEVRKAAAWTLGEMGSEATTALPDLKRQMQDWKDSQYPVNRWQSTSPPESPRARLERSRWLDTDNPLTFPDVTALTGPEYLHKSIQQIIHEAITKIEAAKKSP